MTTSLGQLLQFDESLAKPPEKIATGLPLPHDGLAISPDGNTVVVCAYRAILWFDTRTGERHRTPISARATTAEFSADGGRLAVTNDGPEPWIFNAQTRELIASLAGHQYKATGSSFHPDGARLATGGADLTTRLWDPETGNLIAVFKESDEVNTVAWSPDGTQLATLLKNGTIVVREAPGYVPVR